jgi:hypothetical protein
MDIKGRHCIANNNNNSNSNLTMSAILRWEELQQSHHTHPKQTLIPALQATTDHHTIVTRTITATIITITTTANNQIIQHIETGQMPHYQAGIALTSSNKHPGPRITAIPAIRVAPRKIGVPPIVHDQGLWVRMLTVPTGTTKISSSHRSNLPHTPPRQRHGPVATTAPDLMVAWANMVLSGVGLDTVRIVVGGPLLGVVLTVLGSMLGWRLLLTVYQSFTDPLWM